jgi:hypothetical protein
MANYIYENIEVRSTGRIAKKINDPEGKFMLIEVTPINEDDGTWNKWVPARDLYEIIEPKNLNN